MSEFNDSPENSAFSTSQQAGDTTSSTTSGLQANVALLRRRYVKTALANDQLPRPSANNVEPKLRRLIKAKINTLFARLHFKISAASNTVLFYTIFPFGLYGAFMLTRAQRDGEAKRATEEDNQSTPSNSARREPNNPESPDDHPEAEGTQASATKVLATQSSVTKLQETKTLEVEAPEIEAPETEASNSKPIDADEVRRILDSLKKDHKESFWSSSSFLFKWSLVLELLNLKGASHPNSFSIPLLAFTFITYYSFQAIDHNHLPTGNKSTFESSCPAAGRRTQVSAVVKLFAATVTTVAINGHLGSLAGSDSWQRELFRALEVLISPLAALFHVGSTVFFELALTPSWYTDSWKDKPSLRYRLARMCDCRVTPTSAPIGTVNPTHLQVIRLPRTLRWFGRLSILVILFAQYTQAALLLTRRFLFHRAATIDLGMFFMVISGTTALSQSLAITLLNTTFTVQTDFEPCTAEHCRMPECKTLKSTSNLPHREFSFIVFGYQLADVPRYSLHVIAGGNLQLALIDKSCRRAWWLWLSTYAIQISWIQAVNFCTHLSATTGFWRRVVWPALKNRGNQNSAAPSMQASEHQPHDSSSPDSTSQHEDDKLHQDVVSSYASSTPRTHLALSAWGFFIFCYGLLGIALVLHYTIRPFVDTFSQIREEISAWESWDAKTPCPQMWKDELEDSLWWF